MVEIFKGSIIGNYRVLRILGEGGMGTVYEVEHLELGTHYALKTFTLDERSVAKNALKKKFLEEGKLLARLKHPGLTHVFDLGVDGNSQMTYFVMDLVTYEDGETYTVEDIELDDIDEDMVRKWFAQLASALDYIHGEGIVHRDIKPSNLLVDKDLNVILTDFGISRIFGSKIKGEIEATKTMVTKTGRGKLILGTDQYIAPEVMAGHDATPQADAYALGVMLLRWLTGFYYRDNPGALSLLSKKKYAWRSVVGQLLAPAGKRPENYAELVKLLKPPAVNNVQNLTKQPKGKSAVSNSGKRKASRWLVAAGIAGLACAGGYLCWNYVTENNLRMEALARKNRSAEEAERKARAEAEAAQKAKELAAEESKRIADAKAAAVVEAKNRIAVAERVAPVATTDTEVPVAEKKTDPVLLPSPSVEKYEPDERPKATVPAETGSKIPMKKDIRAFIFVVNF